MNEAPNPQCVLVVDDEGTIRELVADALREVGFVVETAANGAAALDLIGKRVPDAIILDLMMPRLDGVSFVELLRLNPLYAGIPVVLVTAAYHAVEAAERVGAQACLTKPFELDHLVDAVRAVAGPTSPVAPRIAAVEI